MAPPPKPGSYLRGGASQPPPSADAIFEILSWLPVRSLCRFRCVCTSWRALVSDPAFIAAHRSRAEPLLVATAINFIPAIPTTFVKIMDADGYVVRLVELDGLWKFRASVDSIVLLTRLYDDHSPSFRVVDLATGEISAICLTPTKATKRVTTWFGFGRAVRSGVPKVIRVVSRLLSGGADDGVTCDVLTLGDGPTAGWRLAESPPYEVSDYSFDYRNDGAAVNGVLHFLASTWQGGIARFDLESEEWTAAIQGPREGADWHKKEIMSLSELNGALCIAHENPHTVDLWLLSLAETNRDDVDAWVKAYTIPFVDLPIELVPLRVMRRGGKLLFYYRRNYGSHRSRAILQVYDRSSGKCSDVEKAATDITAGTIGLCSSQVALGQ